jgi:hypothetical protein
MGQHASRFFDEAGQVGGLVAKVKLASLARLTSTEAEVVEDSPTVIRRLEDALGQLRAEHARADETQALGREGSIAAMHSGSPEATLLRKQLQTYAELITQRNMLLGNVDATIRRINEAASLTLGVERVSVWFLDERATKITCADLYVRTSRQHTSGTELFAKDFAPYFAALKTERTIAAGDAHRDPRTSCFSASYLKPLGINSMLDVPIWHADKMVGVVCHEHVGTKRTWNSDEESFAYLMSHFVALALERRKPK